MKIIFILILLGSLYINNAIITKETAKIIDDKYWEIHRIHANSSYARNKAILEKFKNKEITVDDILKTYQYMPERDRVTVDSVQRYLERLNRFVYDDATCFLCFENAKRWYWETYEKNY